ncbi:hypothetical protein ACQCVP_16910 [Rossellomorea vietnamensis]
MRAILRSGELDFCGDMYEAGAASVGRDLLPFRCVMFCFHIQEQKRMRLDQPRQANVPQRKKGALSFYSLRVI